MKKTKILLPAMGLIAFATAASVVGSVAWFTASKAYQMQAASFAVVNTKQNLECVLAGKIGTQLKSGRTDEIEVLDNKVLTDASVDHVYNNIIEPDANGINISAVKAISTADLSSLQREAGVDNPTPPAEKTPFIYSAFAWTATFKLQFSNNADKKVGLYLDLGSEAASYMHLKYVAEGGEDSSDYFTDPACKTPVTGATLTAEGIYYKEEPEDTGKGFRIAIVPNDTNGNAVTKVWGAHNTDTNLQYIDAGAAFSAEKAYALGDICQKDSKYYKAKAAVSAGAWDAEQWDEVTALADMTKNVAAPLGMDKNDDSTIPTAATSSSAALSGHTNYLGYFDPADKDGSGSVELSYTFVAYYEGTDSSIQNTSSTVYETMVLGMDFGVYTFSD